MTTSNETTERDAKFTEWFGVMPDSQSPQFLSLAYIATEAWNAAWNERASLPPPSAEPVAWQRKWDAEGEVPRKEKNAKNRWAWPSKFKFLPITKTNVFPDDVPLYAAASPPIQVAADTSTAAQEVSPQAPEVSAPPIQVAPSGWKMVPEVPTVAMVEASMWEDGASTARAVWRLMLAAAPVPQVAPEQASVRALLSDEQILVIARQQTNSIAAERHSDAFLRIGRAVLHAQGGGEIGLLREILAYFDMGNDLDCDDEIYEAEGARIESAIRALISKEAT